MLVTGCYTIIGIASLQLALGQQRAILTKIYETSKCPSTLTTGHKGCIWPKNLKTFCENFIFLQYKPKKLAPYTYPPRIHFRFGRKYSKIFLFLISHRTWEVYLVPNFLKNYILTYHCGCECRIFNEIHILIWIFCCPHLLRENVNPQQNHWCKTIRGMNMTRCIKVKYKKFS